MRSCVICGNDISHLHGSAMSCLGDCRLTRVEMTRSARYKNMTSEQIEKKLARCRVVNMTSEQIDKNRARGRKRYENLSPEQKKARRVRDQQREATPERSERNRARFRIANMTPEQIEKKRASARVASAKRYAKLQELLITMGEKAKRFDEIVALAEE